MSSLALLFSRIDLFGKAVELNFNGGRKARTRVGGVFTLLFLGFWIWAIYDVGNDIIKKQDPSTLTSEYFSEDPAEMKIHHETFSFGFGLEVPITNSHYINESIYQVQVTIQEMRRVFQPDGTVSLDWRNISLEVEPCTQGHFGSLGPNFANLQLDQLYCLKKEQPNIDEVVIRGMWDANIFDLIRISIIPCNNDTSSVPCAPPEEIDWYFGGAAFFGIYFSNLAVNSKNYTAPTNGFRDSVFTLLGNKCYKQLFMYLGHMEMTTDSGWLTDDIEKTSYIKYSNTDESVTVINGEPNTDSVLDLEIRVSPVTTVYSRSYIKIQDIVARANGLTSIALIILLVFVSPYSNLKFYESLINDLFDVKTLHDEKDNGDPKDPKILNRKATKFAKGKTIQPNKKKFYLNRDEHKTILDAQIAESPTIRLTSEPLESPKPLLQTTTENFFDDQKPSSSSRQQKKSLIKLKTMMDPPHSNGEPAPVAAKKKNFFTSQKSLDIQCLSSKGEESFPRSEGCQTDRVFTGRKKSLELELKLADIMPKEERELKSNLLSPEKLIINPEASPLFSAKPSPIKVTTKILEGHDGQAPKSIDSVLESVVFDDQEQVEQIQEPPKYRELKLTERSLFGQIDQPKIEEPDHILSIKSFEEGEKEDAAPKQSKEDDSQESAVLSKIAKEPDGLNITFWDYTRSFIKPSAAMKDKMKLLNNGINRINERLDIFQMFKKFREIDKLKSLLLEYDQLILFEGLPKPELILDENHYVTGNSFRGSISFSRNQLKQARFVNEKRKHDLVSNSYLNIKYRNRKSTLDRKFLEIYNEMAES